jgi:hypothetical protein
MNQAQNISSRFAYQRACHHASCAQSECKDDNIEHMLHRTQTKIYYYVQAPPDM